MQVDPFTIFRLRKAYIRDFEIENKYWIRRIYESRIFE